MTEAEIDGHTLPVFENAPPSLRVLFELAGAGYADKPFLVYEDERSTFAETVAAAGSVGHLLVDRYGIEPGDRVAIVMRNYPEWIQAFMAVTSVGAIAVAMNAWWTTDELDYGLRDCGARLVHRRPRARRADRAAARRPRPAGAGGAGRRAPCPTGWTASRTCSTRPPRCPTSRSSPTTTP